MDQGSVPALLPFTAMLISRWLPGVSGPHYPAHQVQPMRAALAAGALGAGLAVNAQAREVSAAADILISLLDEAANTAPVVSPRRRPSAARPSPAPSAASPKRAPAPPAGAAPAP